MPLHNFSVILKIPPDAQIRSRIEYLISTEDIHVLHVHSNLFFFQINLVLLTVFQYD